MILWLGGPLSVRAWIKGRGIRKVESRCLIGCPGPGVGSDGTRIRSVTWVPRRAAPLCEAGAWPREALPGGPAWVSPPLPRRPPREKVTQVAQSCSGVSGADVPRTPTRSIGSSKACCCFLKKNSDLSLCLVCLPSSGLEARRF